MNVSEMVVRGERTPDARRTTSKTFSFAYQGSRFCVNIIKAMCKSFGSE